MWVVPKKFSSRWGAFRHSPCPGPFMAQFQVPPAQPALAEPSVAEPLEPCRGGKPPCLLFPTLGSAFGQKPVLI